MSQPNPPIAPHVKTRSSLLLRLAGGWLVLVAVGHTWGYYEAFVTRRMLSASRQQAYELMKVPIDGGIMNASLWTVLQMLALELTFFLAFVAAVSFWIAARPESVLHRQLARIATVTFGLGSLAFLFVHPQINAAVIAVGATILYGLAWWSTRTA